MDTNSTFGVEPERLERLLSAGLEDSDFEDDDVQTASLELLAENRGSRIGQYKLMNVCGEGGMGIVYLAEQKHPIRRQVALKVIKPGMDSKRIIARFEAERQALALLDHPNIAHVYDAGTTESGRPYFVMEYVKGLSVIEHCDHHKLTIEDRLNLFRQICLAVHHAHQKGIIHRDIKPSNILVSTEDDKAIPKIIDFGVAKAIAQPLTERTLATEESQLLGTPEYMSPEQADMASEDIDTRSDIYSLGVLLYVLLAGVLPFDSDTLRTGGIEHIRQIIRETDPKTPSIRLSKLGDDARKVAERRQTEVATLAKCLHRELEWIPLKAIRKERTERYRSASELADDIESYLKGAPLLAGPPSNVYRLKKFVRRNRALVVGVMAVVVALLVGLVVSTALYVRAERASSEARKIADFLENDVLGSAGKTRVGEATVSYILNAASESLEGKFKDKPLIEASIRLKLGYIWRQIGETNEAEQHFLRAIDIYKQNYGQEHLITLNTMDYLGYIYVDQGRYRDAERLWSIILEIRQRVYGVEYPASTINGLAGALSSLGKYDEAESLFKKGLELEEGWYEVAGEDFRMFCYFKCNLASVYAMTGRYEEAEQLLRENINETRGSDISGLDVKYGVNLRYSTILADLYRKWGQYEKAESLFEKNLQALREIKGDEHNLTINCMCGLVRLYVDQDRYEEAEKLFGEALPIARRRLRENHPLTMSFVNAYALLHAKQKQYDQAEILFDEALKGRQHELGNEHPDTLETMNDLAMLYKEQARFDEAERLLFEALEGRRLKLGDTHPHTKESLNNLISLYDAWGKPEQANHWRTILPSPLTIDK